MPLEQEETDTNDLQDTKQEERGLEIIGFVHYTGKPPSGFRVDVEIWARQRERLCQVCATLTKTALSVFIVLVQLKS